MSEQELREKIVKIALNTSWTDMFGDHYSIGESAANAIADALIMAGIGDVSDIRSLADNVMLSVIAHKAEVSSMEQRVKEAEHRAEVAENELKLYKLAVKIWQERYSDIRGFNFNIALKQAEKELAEERKDEN